MIDINLEKAAEALGSSGCLRVAINYGNCVLAQRNQVSGEPSGVSVDLAQEIAGRLNLNIVFSTFEAARFVVDAVKTDQCDLAFLAIDPLRGEHITYTRPYVVILGGYLTKNFAPFVRVEDVDRPGIRIAVGRNAAYDLYLSRTLKYAELVRASTTSGAVDLFFAQNLDLAAGIKSSLIAYAANRPNLKVLEGSFMEIKQAIGVPRRSAAALPYLNKFIEEKIANGFVRDRLSASGQDPDVAVTVSQQ